MIDTLVGAALGLAIGLLIGFLFLGNQDLDLEGAMAMLRQWLFPDEHKNPPSATQ